MSEDEEIAKLNISFFSDSSEGDQIDPSLIQFPLNAYSKSQLNEDDELIRKLDVSLEVNMDESIECVQLENTEHETPKGKF